MESRTARRQARWQAIALKRGPLAYVLWPVSALYGALMGLRHWLYAKGILRTRYLPVPVIVVGNVVVGGAGKTPTVIALINHLRAQGWHPGVVSRGYGRSTESTLAVHASTPAHEGGDEPVLIQRATGVPVFVARQRFDAAQALLAAHPQVDVLLCDDGLQHLALGRTLNVVVFDERGTGNGWLLPAGLLREPWPGASTHAPERTVVLQQHREGQIAPTVPMPPGLPVFKAVRRLADHAVACNGERVPLKALQGQSLSALAGIARPGAFFDMLRARGLTIAREIPLPDHASTQAYAEPSRQGQETLICTEKDAVKLFPELVRNPKTSTRAVWAVPLELVPDADFFSAVMGRLRSPIQTGNPPSQDLQG